MLVLMTKNMKEKRDFRKLEILKNFLLTRIFWNYTKILIQIDFNYILSPKY